MRSAALKRAAFTVRMAAMSWSTARGSAPTAPPWVLGPRRAANASSIDATVCDATRGMRNGLRLSVGHIPAANTGRVPSLPKDGRERITVVRQAHHSA
jgi:hypothetical protein